MKEEEWLLESVGLGTLKSNNLFPSAEQAIRVKDVYEAFLRFDDKPMITGQEAVAKSIQRYCTSGDYCIATGDGTNFSKFFFQENVPFFEVTDTIYWLVDKSLKPVPVSTSPDDKATQGTEPVVPTVNEPEPGITLGGTNGSAVKQFKSIMISGKVPLERYTELFNYFITPFAMNGNRIEIEVRFKIKSNEGNGNKN